jgi:hypothetical protein
VPDAVYAAMLAKQAARPYASVDLPFRQAGFDELPPRNNSVRRAGESVEFRFDSPA